MTILLDGNPTDYSKYHRYHCIVLTRHLTPVQLCHYRNYPAARYPPAAGAYFRLLKSSRGCSTGLVLKMIKDEPCNWFNFAAGVFRSSLPHQPESLFLWCSHNNAHE